MKNGTLLRVVAKHNNLPREDDRLRFKVRKVRPCAGIYSSKERIGKPYTYQDIMLAESILQGKRIGTEEVLNLLFEPIKLRLMSNSQKRKRKIRKVFVWRKSNKDGNFNCIDCHKKISRTLHHFRCNECWKKYQRKKQRQEDG